MNICKITMLLFLTAGTFLTVNAAPPAPAPERRQPQFHGRWDKDSPEAKAAMKRRYEIMILLQAYKLVPDELKDGLKAEIMRRLREDYTANRQHRENIIRFMERELVRLQAAQAADTQEEIDSLMEAEFERLCNMPIDMLNTPDNRNIQGRMRNSGE